MNAEWIPAIAGFKAYQQAGAIRPATIGLRRLWLLRAAGEVGGSPWTATGDDLAAFLARDGWAPETRRSARAALVAFYKWGRLTGRRTDDPTLMLHKIKAPEGKPRPAPDHVVVEAIGNPDADPRVRLVLLFAAYAGLRRGEIAGLHRDMVIGGSLRIVGKGGRTRIVPLHPDLRNALAGWPAEGYLFPRAGHGGRNRPGKAQLADEMPLTAAHVGRLTRDVLPKGWTLHTLRHRFASQAYAACLDLRAIQELLGHSKPETTARYTAVPDGHLASAVMGVGRVL